jgi:hypothetical protein
MIKIEKKTTCQRSAVAACLKNCGDASVVAIIKTNVDEIVSEADLYEQLAKQNRLHDIPRLKNPWGLTVNQMSSLYKGFAKARSDIRVTYDLLRNSAPNNICPYCGQGQVKTLDHFLSKTRFPRLAITLNNLIPCCSDCNKHKGSAPATSPERQLLHPYYEDVDGARWLQAEIIHSSPMAAVFKAIGGGKNSKRILWQFKKLKLAKLYATYAGTELRNKNDMLIRLRRIDRASLERHLQECLEGSASNSWQEATYTALLADQWVMNGGFLPAL